MLDLPGGSSNTLSLVLNGDSCLAIHGWIRARSSTILEPDELVPSNTAA
jgi:hypothetical protein